MLWELNKTRFMLKGISMRKHQAGLLIALLFLGLACRLRTYYQGSIQATVADTNTVRIILPTHERDTEAQEKIHAMAHRNAAGLIDPDHIITDEVALTQDLSEYNLILYGTRPGNAWLETYVAGLPITLGESRLLTGTLHAGPDLGFITCWPHPQNPQRGLVIHTAFLAEDIGLYQQPLPTTHDYLVTRGTRIIEADNYRKDKGQWSFPEWTLNLQQAQADLKHLLKTIESVHPQPRSAWKEQNYKHFKAIHQVQLRRLETGEDLIPMAEFYKLLSRVCAGYQDGHTGMQRNPLIVDTSDQTKRMLPFCLVYRLGQFYVGTTIDLLNPIEGYKILAVNQKPLIEHLIPTLLAISGERQAYRIEQFIHYQRTYCGLFSPFGEDLVDLAVEDPNGESASYVIDLLSVTDYDTQVPSDHGHMVQPFEFYFDNQVCYWHYDRCGDDPDELARLEKNFRILQDRNTSHLILDLRKNRGGSSTGSEAMLSYLMDRPYHFYGQVDSKISSEILERGLQKHLRKHKGKVVKTLGEATIPPAREYPFSGELFVLIGPSTHSTAADLVSVLSDYDVGTLIGEETGGLRESFGNSHSFELPHSGFRFHVSTEKFYPPLPRPDDSRRGTVPDIAVTESLLEPYQEHEDPLFAFVLERVRKRL